MAIMVAGGLTFAVPSTMPAAYAEVTTSNPHLYVSAEGQDADNQFAPGNIIEVIIRDDSIGDTDEGEAEPAVTINGADLRMLQTANGDWRAYFAQADAIAAIDAMNGELDYGEYCSENAASTTSTLTLSDTNGVYFPPGSVDANCAVNNEPVSEQDYHPLIRETRALTDYNPSGDTIGQLGLSDDNLWPFIQAFDFAPESKVNIVYQKSGTPETVTLEFDDPSESHSLDRTKYPQGAHVLVTIEDFALNIDPTDEDTWAFNTDADSKAAYYNLFDEDGNALNIMKTNITDYGGSAGIGERIVIERSGQGGEPLIDCQVTADFGIEDEEDTSKDYLMSNDDGECVTTNNITSPDANKIFADGNFVIGFVEDGSNNNKFINWADDQRSNLVVRDDAQRNRSFEIDYNDPGAISGVVGHFFAELTLGDPGATWNSGERIGITVTDEDVNTNPLAENDLTVKNPYSLLIPSIRIGSPVTLASASGNVTWYDIDDPLPGDTTPPTVVINGRDNIEIIQHITYVDQGAQCTNTDGPTTARTVSNNVNINVAGDYMVTYSCTDAANNEARDTRTVMVIEADQEDPTIELNGPMVQVVTQNVSQTQNENYAELGAVCSDNVDADRPVRQNEIDSTQVDTAVADDYMVTYTCTDTGGNSNSTTRTVRVVDNQHPTITVDPPTQSVLLNSNYAAVELGATCEDNVSTPSTPRYTGNVDTTSPGTYTVTYTCVDDVMLEAMPQVRLVTVVNHEVPIISITNGSDSVEEGQMAEFTVTSFPPSTAQLTVDLLISDVIPSDFVEPQNEGTDTVIIPANTATVTYEVQTEDDRTDENDGSVRAIVTPRAADYTVNNTASSATVTVTDNDEGLSEISITSAGTGGVTEGNRAVFVISANPAPVSPIDVSVTVAQDGDYATNAATHVGTYTVTVGTSGVETLVIPTTDDNTDETDGSLTVTINSDSTYRVSTSSFESTVDVSDDDTGLPEISISGSADTDESGTVTFTVTANPAPTSDLIVDISITETGDYVAVGDKNGKQVTIRANTATETHTVDLVDDGTDESSGTVTATILERLTYYTISSTAGSDFVTITDNDDPPQDAPVISITGGSPVTEGTAAEFTVTSSAISAVDLIVNLEVDDDAANDYVATANEGSKTVTITAGQTSATYPVTTEADSIDDGTSGVVTVTVSSGTSYTPSTTAASATVTVNDNDDPPQDAPVISITGGSPVTEGTAAEFTVTSSAISAVDLIVNLEVDDDAANDYVATANEGSKTVTITAGQISATYPVTTEADSIDDGTSGVVTVTVSSGTSYTPSTTAASATVTVNDNDDPPQDAPVISITGGSPVTEGTAAEFTVTSSAISAVDLIVNLEVDDDAANDYVATANEGSKTVTITAGQISATYPVTTEADSIDDGTSGVVTVTVSSGTSYTPSTTAASATVTVNDNDDPPQERTPPELGHTTAPNLLSFTVDQDSVEWDRSDPNDIRLLFSITATIDNSILISDVAITAWNDVGTFIRILSSGDFSDSDGDANNGVNYAVSADNALTGDNASSGEIIWLVIDDGSRHSNPVWIEVPATGNNVDMTTTPVSYNTAGFPPITRAVINDVSEIPAVHNVQMASEYPKPIYKFMLEDDYEGPTTMYNGETVVMSNKTIEDFSDRLRLYEPSGKMSIKGDSKIVIEGWINPFLDDKGEKAFNGTDITALFNWDFGSISRDDAKLADVGEIILANTGHNQNVTIGTGSKGLETVNMTEIEALGKDVDLIIMLTNTDLDHICSDITLVADFFTFGQNDDDGRVNNAIYRIEVEEVTPDNSDFAGTLEYVMLNQLNYDNPATYTSLRTIDVDASIIVHEDFTDEDSVRINYFDLGADGVATQIAVQQEAPTHSGVVSFDDDNYKIADTVTITLEDADLNVNNDVVDIYTFDTSGNYPDMIGDANAFILDVTFDDEAWTAANCNGDVPGFASTGFTLMETASNSGIFTGDFQVPSEYCQKSSNSAVSVTGVDIEVNYQDFRDASGEEVEVGAGAAIRANTGTVSLDRTVYPVPFAAGIFETAEDGEYLPQGNLGVHIRITDADFDVSAAGEDKIVNASEYLTVKIIRGSSTSSIDLGSEDILEVAPDAGVFELDLTVEYNDGPTQSCPVHEVEVDDDDVNIFNDGCILQGDIIQVEYEDKTDASGEENTITDSATFDLRNGVLQSDKSVYLIGSDMILTLIEPDFDLDNDGAETYPLNLIEWDSDADTTPMGETLAFDPEPNGLRETGDSTGIFQSIIEIPAELDGDRLERGEEIELEYVDYGPSGSDYIGDETEDINLTVATSNFGATVELDQKVYSWTDKVYITIVAPDHNFDSALVDEIGESDSDPIKVATRSADIDNYKLVETGPDTGIFTGEIILIGYDHNADGDTSTGAEGTGYDNPRNHKTGGSGPTDGYITTDDEGGITVSFEFSEDETVVGSALIRWNIGEVQWLEASYPATGTGVVRVIDPDMNLNPESVDNFEVDIWSDKDAGGIDLTVTETNQATGIFEGTVFFTVADESSGHRLRVAEGNTVTAEYDDNTLPDPYTTSDELGVTATTLIGSIVPPLERVPASNLRIVDAFENSLDSVSADQQVQIVADITNAQERSQEFAYLVQVQDENGVTVSLAWISGTLEAGQSLSPSSSWIPTEAGEYTATAFVWESVDNPTALSPPVTTTITVS